MQRLLLQVLFILPLCCSCINNPLDSKQEDHMKKDSPLRALLSKSIPAVQEDSLTMMSNLQKNKTHLMMNRIIFKDSVFVLAIKKQDALFLGIPEEMYERYVEYVANLNETGSNQ